MDSVDQELDLDGNKGSVLYDWKYVFNGNHVYVRVVFSASSLTARCVLVRSSPTTTAR